MRTKAAFLFVLFLSTLTLIAAEPRFASVGWNDDLRSGWIKSQESGQLMVIFATSSQCHYCDLMKQKTWSDPQVSQRMNSEFVPIRLQASRDRDIMKYLGVPAYPTVIVADPTGKVLDHHVGFQTPEQFGEFLNRNRQRVNVSMTQETR